MVNIDHSSFSSDGVCASAAGSSAPSLSVNRRLHRQFQIDDDRVAPGDPIGDIGATAAPVAWKSTPRDVIPHRIRRRAER